MPYVAATHCVCAGSRPKRKKEALATPLRAQPLRQLGTGTAQHLGKRVEPRVDQHEPKGRHERYAEHSEVARRQPGCAVHGVQLVVGDPRAQMMVAVERIVEREAVCYPAVMCPGVLRSCLLTFVPHEAVVVQVRDDLENEDGEHGLAEEEDAPYATPHSKERRKQTKRQRITLNDLVVPPRLPGSPQPRSLDAPRVP